VTFVIQVTGLSKTFGTVKAVDDLTFSVATGKVTGFLGPNGAGKSTTCRLMVGLDSGGGSSTFDGKAYSSIESPMKSVGLLLEAKAFHPTRTARNHLRMLCAANGIDPKRADECLDLVGLTEVAKKKPNGFSLGMGQRLGLAVSLLGDPHTLILDEPGNGLDPQGIQWLRDLLRYLAGEGRTVFVSSHLLSEMEQMAEHVVVIGRGKLIADCPTSEFISQGSTTWVVVRTPNTAALQPVLAARGGTVSLLPDGSLRVDKLTLEAVGDAAFSAGVVLHELSTHRSSLEQAFLELTGDANQYGGQRLGSDSAIGFMAAPSFTGASQ
jgi:ABC-2 type transport system ATP-binding protein